jgi:ribosome-binding protein aMBF1 (putative translation factor)
MKMRTTAGSTKITLTIPACLTDEIAAGIQQVVEQAQKKYDESIDDDKLYTIEEVFGEITPGDCMRGLRAREDLTQKQLAEKLGVRPHHISEMENGRRTISVQMAKKIESIFGIGYKVFL